MPKHRPLLDGELREILAKLANGLFPLERWIEDKNKRGLPPPSDDLPWRKGKDLTPEAIGAIDFFEELLRDPEEEVRLLERWEELEKHPLAHFHLQGSDAIAWRASRGLDPRSQFGVLESENTLVDVDDRPVVRLHFYEAFWPLLRIAVKNKDPQQDWAEFAEQLHKDECAAWPSGQPLRSSTLTFQFGRDLLHAMMNMENKAPDDVWQRALLIELGEHRFFGNEWTREQAAEAVEDFDALCAALRKKGEPPEATDRPTDIPPVGTPPQKPYKGRRSPLVQETP